MYIYTPRICAITRKKENKTKLYRIKHKRLLYLILYLYIGTNKRDFNFTPYIKRSILKGVNLVVKGDTLSFCHFVFSFLLGIGYIPLSTYSIVLSRKEKVLQLSTLHLVFTW